jgi:hypothetical protein
MLDVLRRKGFEKAGGETPLEFAIRLLEGLGTPIPLRVTDLYYGNRFGESPLDAARLASIYEDLRQLRRV